MVLKLRASRANTESNMSDAFSAHRNEDESATFGTSTTRFPILPAVPTKDPHSSPMCFPLSPVASLVMCQGAGALLQQRQVAFIGRDSR